MFSYHLISCHLFHARFSCFMRRRLSMANQEDAVVYASRQFLLVVGHHDHRLVLALAESLDDILDQSAIDIVQSVERLV